jgi:hypothetical protein
MSTKFAFSARMTSSPPPTRIPEGRLEKARFYSAMAEQELQGQKLQSAENFLRLASVMDPADHRIVELLHEVVALRASKGKPVP